MLGAQVSVGNWWPWPAILMVTILQKHEKQYNNINITINGKFLYFFLPFIRFDFAPRKDQALQSIGWQLVWIYQDEKNKTQMLKRERNVYFTFDVISRCLHIMFFFPFSFLLLSFSMCFFCFVFICFFYFLLFLYISHVRIQTSSKISLNNMCRFRRITTTLFLVISQSFSSISSDWPQKCVQR